MLGIESSALNTESFLQSKYFFKMDSVSFQCGGLQAWLFVRNKKSEVRHNVMPVYPKICSEAGGLLHARGQCEPHKTPP